jgi:ATP-binding cassette subfamily B protein
MQTYVSEKVARDLRSQLMKKISLQDYDYIQKVTSSKILTYLTSDVDAIKTFVSQGVSSIISSIFLIVGASILLFLINWQLTLGVLAVVPIIGISF